MTEEDFRTIIGERHPTSVEQLITTKDIESSTEFVLAAHLKTGKETFN